MNTMLTLKDKETRQETIKNFVDSKLELLAERSTSKETTDWWKNILKTAGTFYKYSFRNLMLIQAQKPHASYVSGAKAWTDRGRIVKAGESAVWILAPLIFKEKNKDTGEEKQVMRGFRSVPVFDVSQTKPIDGEENVFEDPNAKFRVSGDGIVLLSRLEAFAASKGWKLTYEDTGAARGVSRGQDISIRNTLNEAEKAKVLAHEIAHELLHWSNGGLIQDHSRSVKEVEAESVAFSVCAAFGIESDSEFYIAAWQNGDETATAIKDSAKRIFEAVKEILSFSLETDN